MIPKMRLHFKALAQAPNIDELTILADEAKLLKFEID